PAVTAAAALATAPDPAVTAAPDPSAPTVPAAPPTTAAPAPPPPAPPPPAASDAPGAAAHGSAAAPDHRPDRARARGGGPVGRPVGGGGHVVGRTRGVGAAAAAPRSRLSGARTPWGVQAG